MPRLIQDEFSGLPISRQRRYQMRKLAAGRCRLCGAPAMVGHPVCERHLADQRRWQRESRARQKTVEQLQQGHDCL